MRLWVCAGFSFISKLDLKLSAFKRSPPMRGQIEEQDLDARLDARDVARQPLQPSYHALALQVGLGAFILFCGVVWDSVLAHKRSAQERVGDRINQVYQALQCGGEGCPHSGAVAYGRATGARRT